MFVFFHKNDTQALYNLYLSFVTPVSHITLFILPLFYLLALTISIPVKQYKSADGKQNILCSDQKLMVKIY